MKTLKFLFTPEFEIGDYVKNKDLNNFISRVIGYYGEERSNGVIEIFGYVITAPERIAHHGGGKAYDAFGNNITYSEEIAFYSSPSALKACPPEKCLMKFSDLRPGMVVKVKWSSMKEAYYLLINTEKGKLFGINECNYTFFYEATEDMKSSDNSWSIEEVYKLKSKGTLHSLLIASNQLKCIWKRVPKYTELTMDQIAEKFKIPVEQLKIKK